MDSESGDCLSRTQSKGLICPGLGASRQSGGECVKADRIKSLLLNPLSYIKMHERAKSKVKDVRLASTHPDMTVPRLEARNTTTATVNDSETQNTDLPNSHLIRLLQERSHSLGMMRGT